MRARGSIASPCTVRLRWTSYSTDVLRELGEMLYCPSGRKLGKKRLRERERIGGAVSVPERGEEGGVKMYVRLKPTVCGLTRLARMSLEICSDNVLQDRY